MRVKKEKQPIQLNCMDCGEVFIAYSKKALRCEKCRILSKKQRSKDWMQKDRAMSKNKTTKMPLKKTIREVLRELEIYNKEHKTRLSYGQFVQKMEGGKL